MATIPASAVQPGTSIRIPGITTTFHTVEMVRTLADPGDPDLRMAEITIWPAGLDTDPFPQPRDERENNFGHFYAQFMVTINVIDTFPIEVH